MTNRRVARFISDEAGNVLGGTGYKVRLYSTWASVLATIYKDLAGSFTRANPGYANSGWSCLLTGTMAPGATSIAVDDTTGAVAGDMFPVVDGVNTVYLVVKTVTSGTALELVAAPGGAHTYAIGSTVGDESMYGHWQCFAADTQDYDLTYENVATSKESPPDPVYTDAAAAVSVDVQTFITAGPVNWVKPSGSPKLVRVIAIGAGGGGGGGDGLAAGNYRSGGGGGGGGGFVVRDFDASALAATVAVTTGAGGTSGAGGSTGNGVSGGAGGSSTFGTLVTAYGGGGGGGGGGDAGDGNSAGGGGAGMTAVGGTAVAGNASNGAAGGAPGGGAAVAVGFPGNPGIAFGGAGGGAAGSGGVSVQGGAGGGGGRYNNSAIGPGGSSLMGGPGGGPGGGLDNGNTPRDGQAGGTVSSYVAGGGGAGGIGTAVGTIGTARSLTGRCGDGSGGGGANAAGTGGAGATGAAPGGGAGGGGAGTPTGGAGGVGGRGEVLVFTFF